MRALHNSYSNGQTVGGSRSGSTRKITLINTSAVAVLASWGLFFSIGLFAYFAQLTPGVGFYGILGSDDWATVQWVAPGTSAAKAGVVEGDTIDERATPFDQQRAEGFNGAQFPALSGRETLRIVHNGRSRTVMLTAIDGLPYWEPIERLNGASQGLVGMLFVMLGALLVLLRPSKMTWAFFISCVGINPSTLEPISWLYWVPHWLYVGLLIGTEVLRAAGYTAIPIFAARFPLDRPIGKLQRAVQTSAVIFFPIFLAHLVYWDVATLIFHRPMPAIFANAAVYAVNLVYLAALAAFIATYRQADANVRQRTRWVIVGFAVGVGVRALLKIPEILGFDIPSWVYVLQTFLSLAIPVSVLYAAVRHRVFDINFVIRHAFMVAAFAGIAFALVDFLSTTYFSRTRVDDALAIAGALLLGFAAHWLYARADRITDRLLFRDRYSARKRLAVITDHLRRANSQETVEELLTQEVATALELASSAAFRPSKDGGFVRGESLGWPASATWHVLPEDPAAKDFACQSVSRLDANSGLDGLKVPLGLGAPTLTVAIRVAGDLRRVLLYGAHRNGADFNPEEINELRWLAQEAGTAWAYLGDATRAS